MFGRNRSTDTPSTVAAPARSVSLVKDPAGAPAVDLDTLTGHVDLTKRAQKAGISLSKRNLAGIRAQAVLILDHSGSMRDDYRSGTVQTLVERALGFALQIDVDGTRGPATWRRPMKSKRPSSLSCTHSMTGRCCTTLGIPSGT